MTIELLDEGGLAPEGFLALAERVAACCMRLEGVENGYACLRLMTDEEIRLLNIETRDTDRATDVLSFPSIDYRGGRTARQAKKRLQRAYDPQTGRIYLGDIAISVERAREQAETYRHSCAREMGYLTAHAMFHLMGYDHMTEDDARKMRMMEKKAMDEIALYRREDRIVTDEKLQELAIDALQYAYTPYSRFKVGACLLAEDGRTFQGANFENASYGAAICAERCAVSNAIAHGARRFTAIAIATGDQYAYPCGICRQVLYEFSPKIRIFVGYPGAKWVETSLERLLPNAFGPADLNIDTGNTTSEE